MAVDTLLAKISFAFIFILVLMWVVRPAISVIGMVPCPGCNPFISAMLFVVVPIGAVFIGLYKIVGVFSGRA
jgi:hypothetical protein